MTNVNLSALELELKGNPNIKDVMVRFAPPITDMVADIYTQIFSYDADPVLLRLYRTTAALKLSWYCTSGDDLTICGEANIQGLLDTFTEDSSATLGCQGKDEGSLATDDAFGEFCRQMVILDRYEEAYQTTRAVTMQVVAGQIERLWFWDAEGDKYPLLITPGNYLAHLVRARAMLSWQYFYIDTRFMEQQNSFYSEHVYGTTLRGTTAAMEEFCRMRKTLFGIRGMNHYLQRLTYMRQRFGL
jgi:hypothetical protein